MKKYILLLLFFVWGIVNSQGAHAAYILKDFSVRNTGTNTFWTETNLAQSGSVLEFRSAIVVDGSESTSVHRGAVLLPNGFTASGYAIDASSDCSNISVAPLQHNYFFFDYTPVGAVPCSVVITVQYASSSVSLGTAQTNVVLTDSVDGVFSNGNDLLTTTNNISLETVNLATIFHAVTKDVNGDGFLDSLLLTLSKSIVANPNVSNFSVQTNTKTATGMSFSGVFPSSTISLNFFDGYLSNDDMPIISVGNDPSVLSGSYFAGVMTDGAAPGIIFSKTGGIFTGAVSTSISTTESGTLTYSLTGTATTLSPVYTGGVFALNTNTTISIYAADIWWNSRTRNVSYTFTCGVGAPANGSISAYPSCIVSCNPGYSLSGGACIIIPFGGGGGGGGGGGWGGGGGGGGWVISIPTTPTGTGTTTIPTSSGAVSVPGTWVFAPGEYWYYGGSLDSIEGLTLQSLDSWYFRDIEAAKQYLDSAITDKTLKKQAQTAYSKLIFSDRAYYLSFDASLRSEYLKYTNAFVLYFIRLQEVKQKKIAQKIGKADILWAQKILNKAYTLVRSIPSTRYVTKTSAVAIAPIYRTKSKTLTKTLSAFEKKTFAPLKLQYKAKKLSKDQYMKIIAYYNSYIINMTVSDMYPNFATARIRAANVLSELQKLLK